MPVHVTEYCPFKGADQSVSCHHSQFLLDAPCLHTSPLLPPHFFRPTPNRHHSNAPDVQTMPHHICLIRDSQMNVQILDSLYPTTLCTSNDIHPTTIHSALYRLCRFQGFIAHVSVPHKAHMDTNSLKLFFMWCTADCQDGRFQPRKNPSKSHSCVVLTAEHF